MRVCRTLSKPQDERSGSWGFPGAKRNRRTRGDKQTRRKKESPTPVSLYLLVCLPPCPLSGPTCDYRTDSPDAIHLPGAIGVVRPVDRWGGRVSGVLEPSANPGTGK